MNDQSEKNVKRQKSNITDAGCCHRYYYNYIDIVWETGPSQEYYEKAVTLLTTAPEDVDILFVDWGYATAFKDAGWIYAIEDIPFITETEVSEIKDDLTADALALFTIDDKLYGLPYFLGPYTMYYNKDQLEDAGYDHAPATWDELLDMSEAMQDMGMFNLPILWALETAPYGAHLVWECIAASIGGGDTKLFGPAPDYEPLFLDSNSAGYKALEVLQKSYGDGLASIASLETSQLIAQSTAQNGEVTPWVHLISPHNMDDMNNPAVSVTAGQWEFMLPPDTGWAAVRGAFFALSNNLMTNKPQSHQEHAWNFMRNYIGSPRWGKEFAIADGLGFGWKELWDDPTIKSAWNKYVNFTAVKEQSSKSIPITTLATVYDAEWFPEWRLSVNAYIQDCFIGELTPQEAAQAIADFTDTLH